MNTRRASSTPEIGQIRGLRSSIAQSLLEMLQVFGGVEPSNDRKGLARHVLRERFFLTALHEQHEKTIEPVFHEHGPQVEAGQATIQRWRGVEPPLLSCDVVLLATFRHERDLLVRQKVHGAAIENRALVVETDLVCARRALFFELHSKVLLRRTQAYPRIHPLPIVDQEVADFPHAPIQVPNRGVSKLLAHLKE